MGLAKHYHTARSRGSRVNAAALKFFLEDEDKKPKKINLPVASGQHIEQKKEIK